MQSQHHFGLSKARDLQILRGTGDVNSFAIVALVLVIGIAAYIWWRGRLRGGAAWVTLIGIIAILSFVAFYSGGPPA